MYRLFIKIITYLVITAFLSQNIVWANGYTQLARDSKGDLTQIVDLFEKNPGHEDGRWNRFNGRKPGPTSIPFHIKPEILQQFQKQLQDLGIIEGDILGDGKVYFSGSSDLIKRIRNKVNCLVEVLNIFGPGTKVRIITDTTKPIFYNKDDNILEIHGLLFLYEGALDRLILFCAHHEARHKEIKGLSPLMEEVLNIYMDFEYMDELERRDPKRAGKFMSELEKLDGSGYSRILRMRYSRDKGLKERDDLLKEVLNYIWRNYPWIREGLNLGDVSKIKEPATELRRKLNSEKDAPYSFINLLTKSVGYLYSDFPQELEPRLPGFIPQIASYLYKHMDIFSRLEEDICKVSDEHERQQMLAKGIPQVYVDRLLIYIQIQERKKLLDELMGEVKSIDRNMGDFIEKIWFDLDVPIERLRTAIGMARVGAEQCAISASLVRGVGLKKIRELVRDSNISGARGEHIISLIENYGKICNALIYKLHSTRHMLQNVLNLIIRLTDGDPDVLMLAIMDKIEYLEGLAREPKGYEKLDEEKKYLLMQTVEWVFVPLAEFFGREDLADMMRGLYLRATLGEELYGVAEKDVCDKVGLGHLGYKDLQGVLGSIIDKVREAVEGLPVKIDGRVKSPYSFDYKPRETKDIFGIRIVITGLHTPEEERDIRNRLYSCLEGLFKSESESEPELDMKKLIDKRYNEYDFIAEINLKCPEFKNLLEKYGVGKLPLEVQIYPTEDDLQRYRYGPMAHWLYKLEAIFKAKCSGAPSQLFDRDILERIYKGFENGRFNNNFKLVYNELKRWKYIGVASEDGLKIIRATSQSIAPDIASAPGIDLFNKGFIGITRIGTEKPIPNTEPDALVPGIYEVVSSGSGLREEELKGIRGVTTKPRTYLIIQHLLRTGLSYRDGEGLLNDCLKELGVGISRRILEKKLFEKKDKDKCNIGLVYDAFSLNSLREFYRLLAEVSQEGQEVMLMELIRRAYSYMTGEDLEKGVGLEDLKQRWGVKSDRPISILVYLFTIAEMGERYLEENIFRTKGLTPEDKRRLLVLLDEFGVERLEQIYSRTGLDKEVTGRIIEMRLGSISSPYISIKSKSPGAIKNDVQDVINRSGWEIINTTRSETEIRYDINPSRYWLERMDMVLEEMRSIGGVDNAELVYTEPENIQMGFILGIKYKNMDKVKVSLGNLFKELGITYSLPKESGDRFDYGLLVSTKISANELEEIIRAWLNSVFGKEARITRLDVRPLKAKKPSPSGAIVAVLCLFLPYIMGSAGSLGIIGYIFVALDIIILAYLGYRLYGEMEKKRFNRKMDELASVWKGYEGEEVRNTELLNLFFEEHVFLPTGADFKEILQGLKLRWAARVVTKVSDLAIKELQYEFQGYIINTEYEGEFYQFFVLGEWEDIAYEVKEGEYVSLGKEILDSCKDRLQEELSLYGSKRKWRPDLRRLVIVPMRDRDILEGFCRDNIIARSVISHFPKTGSPYPNFMHNKYILRKDSRTLRAQYSPRALHTRGIVGKPLFRLVSGLDSLHEICHGIFDYDKDLRERILAHFQRYPNTRLEKMISEIYGYDIYNPDHKGHITDEAFSYTLSEFSGMSRPWREIEELVELGERFDGMSVDEIMNELINDINMERGEYERRGGRILEELREKGIEVGRLWNDLRRGLIQEGEVRRRYYEIAKGLEEMALLPPIRLVDVRFFAEAGLVEPWMNPLELGYDRSQVENMDFWADREYYMRIIEFLIERSWATDRWYKLSSTGEWVEAPFGKEALDFARRLGWGLLKTGYGISALGDLDTDAERDFWASGEVLSTWYRIVEAENGYSIREEIRRFLNDLKEKMRRRKRLRNFIQSIELGYEETLKGIVFREPWIVQAFLEKAVLESPKVLVLDAGVFNELDGNAGRRLVGLINQVNGKVAIVSDAKVDKGELIEKICDFWQRNSIWLNDKAHRRYKSILDNIYIRGDSPRDEFVRFVWGNIQNRFRVEPENIMVFTNGVGFIQLWRKFLKEGLFYILDNGKLYITSEQLHIIQEITDKKFISVKPGEQIELLPEELYKGKRLEEESKSPTRKDA